MLVNPDLTLREVAERLEKSGCKLRLVFEHGVYHAYVHGKASVKAYDRGDLVEAIDGATRSA
jgi:hypothetical protein